MKNVTLADINFREIVDYGGQPTVKSKYTPPLECKGYCIDCEEKGILEKAGGQLTRISHGCDTSDYETILGPIPRKDKGVAAPVMFLLENPGSDKGIFKPISIDKYKKEPPVNQYYWAPECADWPKCLADVISKGNFYNPYFAYLMAHHQLLNVYITNLVKCKWIKSSSSGNGLAITKNCVERYLKRELEVLAPGLVVCFGNKAARGFQDYCGTKCPAVTLWHPAFLRTFWRAHNSKRLQMEFLEENDVLLDSALKKKP